MLVRGQVSIRREPVGSGEGAGMAEYHARIVWQRGQSRFTDNRYSRSHEWRFDEGVIVPASSSPHVVPLPMSVAAAVDPEEAFVASLSSCHMLTFLYLAARRGFSIDSYDDAAVGILEKNAAGQQAITRVTLRPDVRFSGDKLPTAEEVEALHHSAHEGCFIANSVKTEVNVEPARTGA
jgi:organic hydroperoxide reductase OsmC/OhrA